MLGKFIVLYGANNLGKSHQVKLLSSYCQINNIPHVTIKYPIYELEPNGPILNAILRKGTLSHFSEVEVQKIFVQNRKDYEPQLQALLGKGISIIAEDYIGTGIAWGLVRGVRLKTLEKINIDLYPEDCAILLHGERFHAGKEERHRNEADEKLWQKGQKYHYALARKYKWHSVYASREDVSVHKDILRIISSHAPFPSIC